MHAVSQAFGILESYFEHPEDSPITEDESHKETRYAEIPEVTHVAYIAHYDWGKAWRPDGDKEYPLKELAAGLFFYRLVCTPMNNTANALE